MTPLIPPFSPKHGPQPKEPHTMTKEPLPTSMDPETLEALQDSIEPWKAKATDPDLATSDGGIGDCPLCLLFHPARTDREGYRAGAYGRLGPYYSVGCLGCPVLAHTGQPYCKGTPYEPWTHAEGVNSAMAYAQDELEFLQSLLPPTEPRQ